MSTTEPAGPVSPARRRPGPRLRTLAAEAAQERHATWLELFFDLIFVVAVAEVGRILADRPDGTGFARFAALFLVVWWAWVGYTFYADRFDDDTGVDRAVLLVAMLTVAGVAVTLPHAFDDEPGGRAFLFSYAAVRAVLVALYLRAWHAVPAARPLTTRYGIGFGAGLLLWLAAAAAPTPFRLGLAASALLVDLATPLASTAAIRRVPFHGTHIPERFGGFTIIVLGESVVVVTGALGHDGPDAGRLAGIAAFGLAAAVWWVYFSLVDAVPPDRWVGGGQTWLYAHLLIYAGITATAEGALLAVRAGDGAAVPSPARWAVCLGLAGFLLAVTAIRITTGSAGWGRSVAAQAAGVVLLVALALLGVGLRPALLEILAFAVLAAVCATAPRRVSGVEPPTRAG